MKKMLVVCLLFVSSNYAHSEYLYGITGNMAGVGHTWGMSNIGPSNNRGLRVNGVYYQYTPIKETEDGMLVHIRNERVGSIGEYIFSETDDWSGLPGGIPITKGFTVDNLPIELWGDGSISVEGIGSVVDANVVYSYKYNNDCLTPLSDPSCPGYMDAVLAMADDYDATGYNPLDDENITSTLEEQAEADEIEEEKEQEDSGELERALSGVDGSILASNIIAQDLLMTAMTRSIAIDSYYKKTLAGGEYKEKVVLIGGELLDNSKAARVTLAQQLLHTEMVSMQYNQR
ncbi:hypothetical protein OAD64_00180 [Oceanospirillaceae bacterium]|jgi:hypothetical protein|nr:hypothetical protein [Oceanospirillaceae bacterium]|tara:strand:- start:1260 stop:2123 length:864 start_codon:yes stop_codon:yes gene_type:complete